MYWKEKIEGQRDEYEGNDFRWSKNATNSNTTTTSEISNRWEIYRIKSKILIDNRGIEFLISYIQKIGLHIVTDIKEVLTNSALHEFDPMLAV